MNRQGQPSGKAALFGIEGFPLDYEREYGMMLLEKNDLIWR
jgi:hypothetical protein